MGSDVTPGQMFDTASGRFDMAWEGRFDTACVAFPFRLGGGSVGSDVTPGQ
mgnify:CR=1 FL=1